MTAETLKTYSCKDLAEMAKTRGVRGWHAMRKDQLVKALVRASRSKPAARKTSPASGRSTKSAKPAARAEAKGARRRATAPTASRTTKSSTNGKPTASSAHLASKSSTNGKASANGKPRLTAKQKAASNRIQAFRKRQHQDKDLSGKALGRDFGKDRLIVMVRDAFWLHAYWELTRQGVERAQAAMGQDWHTARPVLRLWEVVAGTTTSAVESHVRDIDIHGSVNNWYIDIKDSPKSYRIDIGYVSNNDKFYVLARSNVVTMPPADAKDSLDENWASVAENFEKVYSMSGGYDQDGSSGHLQELFEERLRRPMGSSMLSGYGPGAEGLLGGKRPFSFELDAELIVFGKTEPDARVMLQGDPVKLRPDGTFTVRYSLPNCRQVIPAVACSVDGIEQRTIVLAVERNTKEMEPLIRDGSE